MTPVSISLGRIWFWEPVLGNLVLGASLGEDLVLGTSLGEDLVLGTSLGESGSGNQSQEGSGSGNRSLVLRLHGNVDYLHF